MRATIIAPVTALAVTLGLAACSPEPGDAPAPTASATGAPVPAPAVASAAATASATVSAGAGGARAVKEETDLYEFTYSYPAAAGAIPALKAVLDAELEEQRADLISGAKEDQAERKKGEFPYHAHGGWTTWKVVADLPGWLSLSADLSSYEGGAHPNHGFDTLIWDRQAGERREPLDLFTSKEALSRVIRRDFCRELDRQRAKKRGAPVKSGSDQPFSDCIDPAESTVILGSSNGKAFDRLGVLVGPYEAGPYAEGDYEVTLPVTPAVLAVVKPAYRATFVAR